MTQKPGGSSSSLTAVARLAAAAAASLTRLFGLYLGAVAVFLILLAAVGLDIAVPFLREFVSLYEGLWSFVLFEALETAVEWLAEQVVGWLGPYVAIQPHWRDVFTFLTLYFLADTAQFASNRYWPNAVVSFVGGVALASAAAVICGILPAGGGAVGAGLVAIAAAVGSVFLYWLCTAWAHARWRRNDRPPVESFDQALRSRAGLAVRRAVMGLAIGVGLFCAAMLAGAASPALLSLGCLTAVLGGLWIARGIEQAHRAGVRSWRKVMTYSTNVTMGLEMVGKFAIGLILLGINAIGPQP